MSQNCMKVSRWGLNGRQTSRCRDHAPLDGGLLRTVGSDCSIIGHRRPSKNVNKGGSCEGNTDCFFFQGFPFPEHITAYGDHSFDIRGDVP